MNAFAYIASTEATNSSPIAALGIDVTLLIFQVVAFIILMVVLGKWVYPVFIKIIDKREAMIEESTKAAIEAEKNASKTQAEIDALLKEARTEARDIVATAKEEANAMLADVQAKSKAQADHIIEAAHETIDKEVIAAKKALHNEVVELVALATEKVVGGALDAKVDKKVIENAVKEAN
jgi:F-type H+-transporting ATPase subunit b